MTLFDLNQTLERVLTEKLSNVELLANCRIS